jgi:tetratricopeptide (TPR) repeat protein
VNGNLCRQSNQTFQRSRAVLEQVAILVTTPIITLLEIVRDINSGIFSYDIPPLLGGCRESMRVFSIFSRLNKIVMVSNTAFFSRNIDRANHFLNTALHLFRKIDDEKAIGVASNNLANTLYAKLHHESQTTKDSSDCGNPCMVKEALQHYDKAVNVSQKEFESAAACDKARFAERLGDRLFNRGLFLVFCADYDCAPSDAQSRGYEDISRARIIHYEVKDYLLENKLLFEQAGPYWNRLIRRINCLLALYHDDGLRERWDAETLLDEADQLMMAAWQIPTAPLFHDVTPTGRRQQLEGSAILLCLQIGQYEQAFHLSMRMFAQDEYLLESSCVPAAEALLSIAESGEMQLSAKLQGELKQMLKNRSRSPMEFLTMEKF